MKCPRCGANLPNGATSCGSCGARFSLGKRCPHCQAVIPSQAAVCPKCGKPVAVAAAPNTPQKPAKQKNKPKGAFRWWQVPVALVIFFLGFGSGFMVNGNSPSNASVGQSKSSPKSEQVNLDGVWQQINSNSDTMYQAANISGGEIEVRWVDTENHSNYIYWAGSVTVPDKATNEFTWDSENDTSKTSTAMMASPDATKTFTYSNGQISFEVSLMGKSTIVKMEKTSDIPIEMSQPEVYPTDPPKENATYKIGETWVVDGQWELTITGVRTTDDRNEFSDKTPSAVYIVDYTYKNIGYESDIMDGLFISLDDMIVDNAGKMGYSYPNTVPNVPKETPVGATCDAQVCIGVENPGSFTLSITQLDGNREKQSATFEVEVK